MREAEGSMLIRSLESRFLNRLMVAIFWGEFLELRKHFLQKREKKPQS